MVLYERFMRTTGPNPQSVGVFQNREAHTMQDACGLAALRRGFIHQMEDFQT